MNTRHNQPDPSSTHPDRLMPLYISIPRRRHLLHKLSHGGVQLVDAGLLQGVVARVFEHHRLDLRLLEAPEEELAVVFVLGCADPIDSTNHSSKLARLASSAGYEIHKHPT